jgi:hypothetical protein
LEAPTVGPAREGPAPTRSRALSVVLALELVWLLLVAASVVFLAAHLGPGSEHITGHGASRRVLLLAVLPLTLVVGFALIGARQAVDRSAAAPSVALSPRLRLCLWLAAAANGAVVVSIATSLYHARTTWVVVGLLLAAGLSLVAALCVRTTRPAGRDRVVTPRC